MGGFSWGTGRAGGRSRAMGPDERKSRAAAAVKGDRGPILNPPTQALSAQSAEMTHPTTGHA